MDVQRLFRGEWNAILSDGGVQKRYVRAGAAFGDAISYAYLGGIVGFQEMLDSWEAWEKEYSERGYRTISLDVFVDFGGYGVKIDHLLGQKREENEVPKLHAEIYNKKYPEEPTPVIDLEKMMEDGAPQCSSFEMPSTEQD